MTVIDTVSAPLETVEPSEASAHIDRTPLGPNEGSSYRPLCSCGWEGGLWQSYEDSQFQIEDHIRHPEGIVAK